MQKNQIQNFFQFGYYCANNNILQRSEIPNWKSLMNHPGLAPMLSLQIGAMHWKPWVQQIKNALQISCFRELVSTNQ